MISTPSTPTQDESATSDPTNWRKIVKKYQVPCLKRSIWQLVNSMGPYFALWIAMYYTKSYSWPLTLGLAALAGLFVIRIFIIFHDCGHGSFFKSKTTNNVVGFITGLVTLTPYRHWRWQHAVHHGTSGNLDERGLGDIWTMTVNEFKAASPWMRFRYRISRNPIVVFAIAPLGLFFIYQRFPCKEANKRDRKDLHIMNASILVYCTAMSLIFGLWSFLAIQVSITLVSGTLGVWLFYVQHQFEDTYWRSGEDWDYLDSAMQGSSFYKLPAIMNWFSGSIGYHHIHHLSSRIPNYYLKPCHEAEPFFQQVPELTLRTSIKSFTLRLWDEDSGKLVGYRVLRESAN